MKKICLMLALVAVLFTCGLGALVQVYEYNGLLHLTTLYGSTVIHEPVLIELIKSAPFERLKKIHQYGVIPYVRFKEPNFTRYEHSLGVLFLTRIYGAPLEEQIAALLHDVSHTIFSHVGDRLFKSAHFDNKYSYQDSIHEWYLREVGIDAILSKHGYDGCCSPEAKKLQRCFEQDSPALCADRIEYNLSGGFIDGYISHADIQRLLRSLHFDGHDWFFDDITQAHVFGLLSLELCVRRWGAPWVVYLDGCAARVVQRACDIGLITMEDVHFSYDDLVWDKLYESDDQEIRQLMRDMYDYAWASEHQMGSLPAGKFSGTDPFVATSQGLQQLTVIDARYRGYFEHIKRRVKSGCSGESLRINAVGDGC